MYRVTLKRFSSPKNRYSAVSNNSGDGIILIVIVANSPKMAKNNNSGDGIIVADSLNPKKNNSLGIQ